MPRKPRIEFHGAFYHVITRGNQRQKIFKEPADYQKYHQVLTVYKNRYRYHLYAYILMRNHVHLLIETEDIPLSKILQGINQTYTMHFNRKYRTVGHLFQGRYKAILCDRDQYLLALIKYIHHNPIRAKTAEQLDSYAWSSHHAYTGKSNPLSLVDTDHVLKLFSESKARSRQKYREFMAEGEHLTKFEVYATVDQRVQGSEEFVERVLEKHTEQVDWPKKKDITLDQIAAAIEQLSGVKREDIISDSRVRTVSHGRRILIATARMCGYRGREIAQYLSIDPSLITRQRKDRETAEMAEETIKHLRLDKSQ